MMYYKPVWFSPEELVPPQAFRDRGSKSYQLLDIKLLVLIDALREEYGSATVNNWAIGGDRQWSGLRTSDSPYYSRYSQHTFGRAVDIVFSRVDVSRVRSEFKKGSWDDWLIEHDIQVTIEEGVSWLHIDVRNSTDLVSFFNP